MITIMVEIPATFYSNTDTAQFDYFKFLQTNSSIFTKDMSPKSNNQSSISNRLIDQESRDIQSSNQESVSLEERSQEDKSLGYSSPNEDIQEFNNELNIEQEEYQPIETGEFAAVNWKEFRKALILKLTYC